jgi:hypothetical protein
MGVGDFVKQDKEYRAELAARPLDGVSLIYLCDVLTAGGQADQARQALQEFEQRAAPANYPGAAAELKELRMAVLYEIGDFPALSAAVADTAVACPPTYQAETLLCTGKPDDVAKSEPLAKQWDNPWNALEVSVAFARNKQHKEADQWRDRAAHALRQQGPDATAAADMLEAAALPGTKELLRLQVMPQEKVVLLAALLQRFP